MKSYAAWTTHEIALLREYYPQGGTAACLPHLPRHTARAIRLKANELGLQAPATGRPANGHAFRCALFSDGMLMIAGRRGRVELDIDETRALFRYLDTVINSIGEGR